MTNQVWPVHSRHTRVGDQEIYVSQSQSQFKGRLSIMRLEHTVICGPKRTNHHVQQFGLLIGNNDMSPLVEARWWG
jgi:hypothetical protein